MKNIDVLILLFDGLWKTYISATDQYFNLIRGAVCILLVKILYYASNKYPFKVTVILLVELGKLTYGSLGLKKKANRAWNKSNMKKKSLKP